MFAFVWRLLMGEDTPHKTGREREVVSTGKPLLLDLFCGAGGASMGYHRAGFRVVGVDLNPQPHYPFEFIQADALTFPLDGFDAIHASPPCQDYSAIGALRSVRGTGKFPRLIKPIRMRLITSGKPWILENVIMAAEDMWNPLKLCGTSFGLRVQRHRLFDSSHVLFSAGPCNHRAGDVMVRCNRNEYVGIFSGVTYTTRKGETRQRPAYCPIQEARMAMGIDWMTMHELGESIPPAYTEWLGRQLLAALKWQEVSA